MPRPPRAVLSTTWATAVTFPGPEGVPIKPVLSFGIGDRMEYMVSRCDLDFPVRNRFAQKSP